MIPRANRILTVAITWLVIVVCFYFFTIARPGLGTKWEQLPPLPEQAASIELTRFGFFLATAENGNAYKRYPWQETEPWMPFDEAAEEYYGEPCEVDEDSGFAIPKPPGEVVSRSSGDCVASAESRYFADVVLLENNEVWLWMRLYGGGSDAYATLLVLAAGALGVVLLLIGWVVKRYDA